MILPDHGKPGVRGQKQTLQHFESMSALPPKADIGRNDENVR